MIPPILVVIFAQLLLALTYALRRGDSVVLTTLPLWVARVVSLVLGLGGGGMRVRFGLVR